MCAILYLDMLDPLGSRKMMSGAERRPLVSDHENDSIHIEIDKIRERHFQNYHILFHTSKCAANYVISFEV